MREQNPVWGARMNDGYWSVIQTETQREHIARMLLMRAGYETYAPRIKRKGNKVTLLFPTYVFVHIVDRWYPIIWTPGVTRILMNGDKPARVPDAVVPSLKKREVRGLIRLPSKQPKRGSRVKIVNGPFTGHVALFDGMTGTERERVLLNLLGQCVPVELPTRDAVPLDVA